MGSIYSPVVSLDLNHVDAADLQAACATAAKAHEDYIPYAENEAKEQYHRRMATRYRLLAELVKKRTEGKLVDPPKRWTIGESEQAEREAAAADASGDVADQPDTPETPGEATEKD